MISSPTQVYSSPSQPQNSAGGRPSARIRTTQEPRSQQGRGLQAAILRSAQILDDDHKNKSGEETQNKKRAYREVTPPRRSIENVDPLTVAKTPSPPSTPTKRMTTQLSPSTPVRQIPTSLSPSTPTRYTVSRLTPATPFKPQVRSVQLPNLFQKVLSQIQSDNLVIGNERVSLTPLDNGSYMNVFAVNGTVNQKSTGSLVVKIFNEQHCGKHAASFLTRCMTNSLKFYHEAQKLGVSVATILNEESALHDGYFLQERILYPIDIQNTSHKEQARQIFLTFLQNKNVLFDLIPSNLRVNENGKVMLIDFPEEIDDSWVIFCKHAMQAWCKLCVDQTQCKPLDFLNDFTRDFDTYGYDLAWNQEIANNLVPAY